MKKEKTEAERLFEENEKLAYWWVQNHYPLTQHTDDIIQAALIGLWKAASTFSPEKGNKFATYAIICIRNEIWMQERTKIRSAKLCTRSLDEIIRDADGDEDTSLAHFFRDISAEGELSRIQIQEFLETLSDRDRLLISLRVQGYTQKQISEKIGISQSYISRLLIKIEKKYNSGKYRGG
jgi:RNA polymerase sporulation-specific sigma factor